MCNFIVHIVWLTQNGSPWAKFSQLRNLLCVSHSAFNSFRKLVAKQPKYPSVDDWINKMLNTHTKEYYSA